MALATAVNNGDISEVERLLREGANARDSNILWNAVYLCWARETDAQYEILRALMEAGGRDNINDVYGEGRNEVSLLWNAAAEYGNSRAASILIEYGADPNFIVGRWRAEGATILTQTIADVRSDVVDVLVNGGADVNVHVRFEDNGYDETPLSMAASEARHADAEDLHKNIRIAETLLNAGADYDFVTETGKSIFQNALDHAYVPEINKVITDFVIEDRRRKALKRREHLLSAPRIVSKKLETNLRVQTAKNRLQSEVARLKNRNTRVKAAKNMLQSEVARLKTKKNRRLRRRQTYRS